MSFSTTLLGKRVVGKNKKTGKKTTYASIRCSTGKWATTETVTYQNGKTLTTTVESASASRRSKASSSQSEVARGAA